MKESKTERGFNLAYFKDTHNVECSLQMSSSATEDRIWFGVNNANPKIMASKAELHGIETTETTGWIEYPIPDNVLLRTRMHLNKEQVA